MKPFNFDTYKINFSRLKKQVEGKNLSDVRFVTLALTEKKT